MPLLVVLLSQMALGQTPEIEPEHRENPVYQTLLIEGLALQGATVLLPVPILRDGQSPEQQRTAIAQVVGSDRAVNELLRDSVTAPLKLAVRDVKYPSGVVRIADLWFVIHADLDEVDLDEFGADANDEGQTEVGNMAFRARLIPKDELKERQFKTEGDLDRFVHLNALLLNRIGLEATNRVVATRSPASLVVASRTSPAFDSDAEYPNRWWPIVRKGGRPVAGQPSPYVGWASYAKVTALDFEPGALLIEFHLAFAEPQDWFNGAPLLRSKLSLIAQDQVRSLRREIMQRREPGGPSDAR